VYIPIPEVDEEKCTHCGKCSEVCAYNAIAAMKKKVLVFPELCHGCGASKGWKRMLNREGSCPFGSMPRIKK